MSQSGSSPSVTSENEHSASTLLMRSWIPPPPGPSLEVRLEVQKLFQELLNRVFTVHILHDRHGQAWSLSSKQVRFKRIIPPVSRSGFVTTSVTELRIIVVGGPTGYPDSAVTDVVPFYRPVVIFGVKRITVTGFLVANADSLANFVCGYAV